MAHYQPGVCFHCGRDDEGGSDWEDWAVIDSVVFGAGFRTFRHTAAVETQLAGILVCPACLASPWGADLLAAPMTAASRVDGCEIHCAKAGPGRIRFFTTEHGRCPVCYGRAEAIRTEVDPRPPLVHRAARAVAHAVGQLALALAGDLGEIAREYSHTTERNTDAHPSGPLPVLVPGRRTGLPGILGARARSALGAGPARRRPDPARGGPDNADGPEPDRLAPRPSVHRAR